MKSEEDRLIERDRLRFIKNKTSSMLCYLAILADVFYFVSIYSYKSDVAGGSYYYQIIIGASIVYNLVFMLAAFLSSEGVKNYKKSYSYVLLALAVIQVARIFILPLKAHTTMVTIAGVEGLAMPTAQFTRCVIYLVVSAACCVLSSVVGLYKCKELAAHNAQLSGQAS